MNAGELIASMQKTVNEIAAVSRKGWLVKPLLYIWLIPVSIWLSTPFRAALAILEYRKYQEDWRYQERKSIFGEDYAQEQYMNNKEWLYYRARLTWTDWFWVFVTPYTIVDRGPY